MAGSSSGACAGEHRPMISDEDEKMVVNMEYSQLPEVVPAPSSQTHRLQYGESPVISPMTPRQPDPFLHTGARRPKPATPWSPASFSSPHTNNAPSPYDPSIPPSTSPSHMSHPFPPNSPYHQPHQRPSFSSTSPFLPPGSTHPPPFPGHPPPIPGYGPGGGPGPIAAARQRRRTRLKRCICLCVAVAVIIAALVVGILVGVVHYRLKHDGESLPAVTTPTVVGRWPHSEGSRLAGSIGGGDIG
ncbi:hypothetical protein BR93DRAFT_967799 [Coniochaeta sp. PMI_546]|nr:hypothetical protein BR93DRAFT_967799 [Coniochaeta sp. PMI_546]